MRKIVITAGFVSVALMRHRHVILWFRGCAKFGYKTKAVCSKWKHI
jgi:hypothetical protein